MQRLFLLAVALLLGTAPAFAQAADIVRPGGEPTGKPEFGVSAPAGPTNSLALLYDNGPLQTGTGNGAGGANTSAIGEQYGSNSFGLQHNPANAATFRIADNFTVPAGGWTISDFQFFAYQTGGNATTSSFTNLYVRIYNGRPGDAGSTVVFGDTTTSRLASSVFSGIYRVQAAAPTGATRPVYRNTATINTFLAAGTYWVEWATTGSLASGPFAPQVSTTGATPPPGNARQRAGGVWQDALDGGVAPAPGTIPIDFPFVVNGTAGMITGPALSVTPGQVAFGQVAVGTTTTARTVTLTNTGTTAVTIASITGSGAPFTVSTAGTTLTLAAGASTTFTVTYSPTAASASTGSVSIVSNAPGSPASVALTGTGFAPPSNDNIANATVLTAVTGTLTGSSANATLEAGEPVPTCQTSQGASVWWRFTPPTAGRLTVDLSQSSFDTVLTFHQPGTTQIGCDDDGATTPNGLASILTDIPVTAGTPVLIRIAGFGATPATGTVSGTYTFTGTTAGEGAAATGRMSLTATPNPVQGAARVRFTTATAADVTVAVYDVTGRQVATLFQGAVAADQTVEASLNAAQLPAGVYVVRATGVDVNLTQRVTVVR